MARPTIPPSGPIRKSNFLLNAGTMIVSAAVAIFAFATAWFPPAAAAVSHGIDRVSNGIKSRRELKARMEWYRPQIAQTLGIDPERVTVKDFKAAARINPMLAAAVTDVKRNEAKENKSSVVINSIGAIIPGAPGVMEIARMGKIAAGAVAVGKNLAATMTGGMLVEWTHKERVSAQEVIEGISSQLTAAQEQGVDPRTVVTPQMVFLLRVAQDEALYDDIKKRYHKPFQKMTEAEQSQVMLDFKPLADAVTSEAYAVSQNMLPVQELMARAPNLKSNASKYALGAQNASFVDNLNAQRALASQSMDRSRLN